MNTKKTTSQIDAVLMLHWGWTDLLQHVGMVRYYKEMYNSISLVCLPHQRIFLEALYPDFNLIFVPCPDKGEIDDLVKRLFNEDYLFLFDGHQCSQNLTLSFSRQNLEPKTEVQHMNCEAYKKSALHRMQEIKDLDANDSTFDERVGFYTLSGMDHSIAFDYFDIVRDGESEDTKYNELVSTDEYSVVHYVDDMKLPEAEFVYLNDKSDKIVDTLKIIENSKEVHVYDSLYGVLCYFLYFSGKLRGPKFYFHKYARLKIPKFFNYDWMKNSPDWEIIE
tara:strand:+ start:538 stop:1371 length:834 start_codon:yes stop_codon:yes gene_type:complete